MAGPSVADLARWFTRRIEEGDGDFRRKERERPERAHLTIVPDPTGVGWVIEGRLDPKTGSTVMRALEAAEEELLEREGEPAELEAVNPRAARRADALELVLRTALSEGLEEPVRPETEREAGLGKAGDVSAETCAPPDGGG